MASKSTTPGTVIPALMSTISVEVGKIQDHYQLIKRIGRGAFSVVYQAVEIRGKQRTVALKVTDFNVFQSEREMTKRQQEFEGELELLDLIESRLGHHPNLVRVYGVCRDVEARRVAISMELLTGGELFDRITQRKKFTENDAALVMRSVMIGLRDLHAIGVIHCDLKPENLILAAESDESPIKITDFGLSKASGKRDYHAGSLVGTAQYVCPEAIARKEYSPESDVWSMGVVLYILLCGYPPFYGKSNFETFDAIKRGQVVFHEKFWKNVSNEAKGLVLAMLTVDPRARATVQQVLDHVWFQNVLKLPSAVDLGPEMLENLRKFNGKRKLKAAAMAVMVGARFGIKKRMREIVERSPVDNFSLDQMTRLRESFRKYATENQMVNKEGFSKALADLGFKTGVPSDALFRLFDSAGEGSISYKAFLTNLSTLKSNGEDSIKFCFDVYDENGDGALSKEELTSVLRNLLVMDPDVKLQTDGMDHDEAIEAHIEDIFIRLDADQNGKIDFDEFKQGILRDRVLVESILGPIQDFH